MKNATIIPFKIEINREHINDIQNKVKKYNWRDFPKRSGWQDGVGYDDLLKLVNFWNTHYNWYDIQEKLNLLPNYKFISKNYTIHFLHFKTNGSKPPILLLHGWPGSYLEFENLMNKLAVDGHDVIVPSLPGFAFSSPLNEITGPKKISSLFNNLMNELFGETKYIIQGGDWGAHIASWMAYLYPDKISGIHLNMVGIISEDNEPKNINDKLFMENRNRRLYDEQGYNHQQETRPQTLSVALYDSPVGTAAWILEKFGKWADLSLTKEGSPDIWSKFDETQILTNIMLYLVTNTIVSSTWIYRGMYLEKSNKLPLKAYIKVPTGIAAFPDPVFTPTPKSIVEYNYNVVHWSTMDKGGHFAALEEPEVLYLDFKTFISEIV